MTTSKPTIVFCHGIWADGSCFNKVIPALQADGHEVIAVQYSLESYEEDLAVVKRTLNRVGSPVLLVGHSYGGATITGAGMDDRVVGLVYIAAVAPDAGETDIFRQPRGGRRQPGLDAPLRHGILRRRPAGSRAEAGVGDALPERRPIQ